MRIWKFHAIQSIIFYCSKICFLLIYESSWELCLYSFQIKWFKNYTKPYTLKIYLVHLSLQGQTLKVLKWCQNLCLTMIFLRQINEQFSFVHLENKINLNLRIARLIFCLFNGKKIINIVWSKSQRESKIVFSLKSLWTSNGLHSWTYFFGPYPTPDSIFFTLFSILIAYWR